MVQNQERGLLRKRAGTHTSATLQRNTVRDYLVDGRKGVRIEDHNMLQKEATRVTLLATSVIRIQLRFFFFFLPRSWTRTDKLVGRDKVLV